MITDAPGHPFVVRMLLGRSFHFIIQRKVSVSYNIPLKAEDVTWSRLGLHKFVPYVVALENNFDALFKDLISHGRQKISLETWLGTLLAPRRRSSLSAPACFLMSYYEKEEEEAFLGRRKKEKRGRRKKPAKMRGGEQKITKLSPDKKLVSFSSSFLPPFPSGCSF